MRAIAAVMAALCIAASASIIWPRAAQLPYDGRAAANVAFGTLIGALFGGAALYRRAYLYFGEVRIRVAVPWVFAGFVIALLGSTIPYIHVLDLQPAQSVLIVRALLFPIGLSLLFLAVAGPLPAYTPWGTRLSDDSDVPAEPDEASIKLPPMVLRPATLGDSEALLPASERAASAESAEATAFTAPPAGDAPPPAPASPSATGHPGIGNARKSGPTESHRRRLSSGPTHLEVVKNDEDPHDDAGASRRNRAGS